MSPLLALFARSLREDSRAKITYLARGGLAFLILCALGFVATTTIIPSMLGWGAPGLQFFSAVIFINFFVVTIAGVSHFASAIAEEKEEQTLGLLRMTNLNALSILLGKSTSRLCGALLLLVAQFPFLLLAVTLGGVSLGQVAAACATLAAYIFLLSNLALVGSVIARGVGGATLLTIIFLAVFFSFGGLVEGAREKLTDYRFLIDGSPADALLQRISELASTATPLDRLTKIVRTGFSNSPFGWQAATNLALGIFAFLIAWAAFTRFCDRDAEAAPADTRASSFLRRRFSPSTRPWRNALAWKDFNFFCGGRTGVIVRLLGCCTIVAWVTLRLAADGNLTLRQFGASLHQTGIMALTIELAVAASRIFRHEARDQTLSTLALLPLTMRQIIRRKTLGWLPAVAPAFALVLAGLFCAGGEITIGPRSLSPSIESAFASVIGAIFLGYLVAFLSLRMKRGALPLGFIVSQIATMVPSIALMVLMMIARGPGAFAVINLNRWLPLTQAVLQLVAISFLHRRLAPRLEILAAE